MKKGDVGRAKHFSKKYGNKGWVFYYPVSSAIWNKFLFCQDACQCLMLHPYIHMQLEKYYTCYIERRLHRTIQPRLRLTIGLLMFNVLIQLKIIHYWWWFWRQWCTDVASGIDRHPDRTEIDFRLQILGNRRLIPCSRTDVRLLSL